MSGESEGLCRYSTYNLETGLWTGIQQKKNHRKGPEKCAAQHSLPLPVRAHARTGRLSDRACHQRTHWTHISKHRNAAAKVLHCTPELPTKTTASTHPPAQAPGSRPVSSPGAHLQGTALARHVHAQAPFPSHHPADQRVALQRPCLAACSPSHHRLPRGSALHLPPLAGFGYSCASRNSPPRVVPLCGRVAEVTQQGAWMGAPPTSRG